MSAAHEQETNVDACRRAWPSGSSLPSDLSLRSAGSRSVRSGTGRAFLPTSKKSKCSCSLLRHARTQRPREARHGGCPREAMAVRSLLASSLACILGCASANDPSTLDLTEYGGPEHDGGTSQSSGGSSGSGGGTDPTWDAGQQPSPSGGSEGGLPPVLDAGPGGGSSGSSGGSSGAGSGSGSSGSSSGGSS